MIEVIVTLKTSGVGVGLATLVYLIIKIVKEIRTK